MKVAIVIGVIVYLIWGTYSGYKVLTGRSEWLDRKEPANRIVKFLLCFFVGTVLGVIYLIILLLKLMGIVR